MHPGHRADDTERLRASGLFDADWYTRTYIDVQVNHLDAYTHFIQHGWREKRFPNPYFHTDWYLERFGYDIPPDMNPLLHYLDVGESAGYAPSLDFDPAWYRQAHVLPAGQNALAHYLAHCRSGTVSPRPDFDPAEYLARHPIVKLHGRDPYWDSVIRRQQDDFPLQDGMPSFYTVCEMLGIEDRSNPPAQIAWEDLLPLLRRVIHILPFDEASYLDHNPDVAAAVAAGDLASGKWHYVMHGYFEGRVGGTLSSAGPNESLMPASTVASDATGSEPGVRAEAANARWVARSQYSNAGSAEPVELLPARAVAMPMGVGEEWCDRWCRHGPVRDFRPFTVDFQAVRMWNIPDGHLSDGSVVWRDREIFVDASIYSQTFAGRQAGDILEAHRVIAEACSSTVITDFSDETALAVHNEGGGTWGHFLIQNFPKMLLYLERHPQGRIVVPAEHKFDVATPGPAQLLRLFGIDPDRLIPVDRHTTYVFKTLVIMDFMFDFPSCAIRPEALEMLQAGARELQPTAASGHSLAPMMIEREPHFSGRRISNLPALQPSIQAYGLKALELGARPLEEQIGAWREGRLMVSTLGSDLSNMIFAPPGTPILALTPDWFGDDFFFRLACACRLPWYEVRCGRRTSDHEVEHRADFDVDPEMFEQALAKIASKHGDRL